jgi:hypothetical protein
VRLTATVDADKLRQRIVETVSVAEAARRNASLGLGAAFTEAVTELTPKDTNRLHNGWVHAARDVGVTDQVPLPVEDSRHMGRFMDELLEQEKRYAEQVESHASMKKLYERQDAANPVRKDGTPRKKRTRQPYYKKILKRLRAAEKKLKRVREEIEKAAGVTGVIFFSSESVVGRNRNQAFTTVRATVYGGEGRVVVENGRTFVELRNQEPHVRVVEANPNHGHPVATALELTRGIGVTRGGHAYRRTMRDVSAMGARNASGVTVTAGLPKAARLALAASRAA